MRECLTARLNRGKIECRLSFFQIRGTEDLQHINANLLQKLLELNRTVRVAYPTHRVSKWRIFFAGPEYWGRFPVNRDLREPCMELLHAALDEFAAARAREGEKLKAILLERLCKMRRLAAEVCAAYSCVACGFQEKIKPVCKMP